MLGLVKLPTRWAAWGAKGGGNMRRTSPGSLRCLATTVSTLLLDVPQGSQRYILFQAPPGTAIHARCAYPLSGALSCPTVTSQPAASSLPLSSSG
jgi:hypothetical protein